MQHEVFHFPWVFSLTGSITNSFVDVSTSPGSGFLLDLLSSVTASETSEICGKQKQSLQTLARTALEILNLRSSLMPQTSGFRKC